MFEEMKSYIIIFVVVVKFGPPFPGNFFFRPERDFITISPTSLRNWICLPLMVMRHNMIRITFTALILRVIVNKVSLKVLPQIQRKE